MFKSLVVVAGLSFLAGNASADSKSWGALKGKLPAGTIVVGGADIAAMRATPSFPKLVEWITKEDKDVGAMLGLVKQTCGMELPAMVGDIALAIDDKGKGVLVVGLSGIDQTKLTDCVTKVIAKVEPKVKLTGKATGKITEYSMTGENDKFYASWLAPDLVAISLDENSHAPLDAMMQGAAATGDLGTYLSKAGTVAAGWGAFLINADGVKGGYGTLALGPTLKFALRVTAVTPKEGDKGRKEMLGIQKKGLERSAKIPEMKKVFQALKVGGKGTEVTVDVAVPEASLPTLLPAFDKVF